MGGPSVTAVARLKKDYAKLMKVNRIFGAAVTSAILTYTIEDVRWRLSMTLVDPCDPYGSVTQRCSS